MDGSIERVTVTFPTGTHDFISQETLFTPSKPIQNFTFVILLAKEGTSYFTSLSFQEKVPDATQSPYVCFLPYGFDPNWEKEGKDPCQVQCPVEGIWDSDTTYHATRPVFMTLSWLSIYKKYVRENSEKFRVGFLGNVFIIITWMTFKEKKKYPERIVLYFSISVLVVSLNGVIQSFMTKEQVTCSSQFSFLQVRSSFLCGFLGKTNDICISYNNNNRGVVTVWSCRYIRLVVMYRNKHMGNREFSKNFLIL